jgi:hypothetical protein
MGMKGKAVASMGDKGDDLTRITGIGGYWANALNRVGIRRFGDLAQQSPSDLSELLEKAGFKASPEKTEKWIEEAKERSWKTHAEFSVFFEYKTGEHGEREWQTRVYGEKRAGVQAPFQGVEPALWTEWILEQANLPADTRPLPPQIEPTPEPAPVALDDLQIEIRHIRLFPIEPSPGVRRKRLEAEVSFCVSGPIAIKRMADRAFFQVEIYFVDPDCGAFDLVASQGGRLEPEVAEYTSLQAFPVPGLGCYQVYAIVLLLPPCNGMTYRRGPTLTVVP